MNKVRFDVKINIVKVLPLVLLFVVTAILVYFSMAISPRYSMVYALDNQTIFYLFGKMMKAGKICYIDMIDHKGIYIFLMHYIAEIICEESHIGLYLVGVLTLAFSAIVLYKLMMLFDDEMPILKIFASILFVALYSTFYFSSGALECETFALLAIMLAIYYFSKSLITRNKDIIGIDMLFYGILFAFILFLKSNYVLFFLSILIFRILDLRKNSSLKIVLSHLLYGLIGIFIGLAPGIMYSLKNNCFNEMIYNTFTVNFLYSAAPYPGLSTKFDSIMYSLWEFKLFLLLSFAFMIAAYFIQKRRDDIKVAMRFIMLSFIIMVLSILMAARPYEYYLIMLLPYLCLSMYFVLKKIFTPLSKISIVKKRAVKVIEVIIMLTIICLICYFKSYVPMIKNGKEQERVVKVVKEKISNKKFKLAKNDELFVLGQAFYIYTGLNTLPSFKYFCLPSIGTDVYNKPFDETMNYLKERKANIVVLHTRDKYLLQYLEENDFSQIMKENYSVLSSGNGITVFQAK